MKEASFYKILLLVLFLGFGRATMATTGEAHEGIAGLGYEAYAENHKNYGNIPVTPHFLFHEHNSKLPSNPELRSYPGTIALIATEYFYLVTRNLFQALYEGEPITVGLDSITIIFPFHTFF